MESFSITEFVTHFIKSIDSMDNEYFLIPTSFDKKGIPRERVFCYELYYQLRKELGNDFPYSLHGELSKQGHLEIDTSNQKVPDFLIHVPGRWDRNEVIIEVKNQVYCMDIRDDILKINSFINKVNYHFGILLIYNHSFKETIDSFDCEFPSTFDYSFIDQI